MATAVDIEHAEGPQEEVEPAMQEVPVPGLRVPTLPVSTSTEGFHKGVAISVWQNSGGENSNWGHFVERTGGCCGLWPTVMDRTSPNAGGCGFWTRYAEDIRMAKELGTNAFRLSLEWHRIETRPGSIDWDAVKRYHEIFDMLESEGMTPNVTLHHFVHPDWFEAKGAWEKEANIPDFINFCKFCAKEWGRRIKFWSTFNEPTCMVFCAYFLGIHPPAHFLNLKLMGTVLFHLMKAHALAYKAMKALPGCDDLRIGIVHHHVEFMPSDPKWFWIRPLCWWGSFWWGRDTVINFMQRGKFEWHVPLWGQTINYEGEKPGLDWWGVNYYARGVVAPYLGQVNPPQELKTDMQYTLYPKGLYECLVRGSQLGVPMYVTEIGCADRSGDDHVRLAHVESFTAQIFRAVKEGYDVRGLYYWTLLDNFEWNAGYLMKFGVYHWDQKRPEHNYSLKPGGRLLAQIYKSVPTDLAELRQHFEATAPVSEYEAKIDKAQKNWKLRPVVWNKGRTVGAAPLSHLANKIGLQDTDDEGDEAEDLAKVAFDAI